MARPKGSPNKATASAREAIAALVEGNMSRLEGWLDQIALESPEKAYRCFMDTVEYHIPKLARTEHTGENGGAVKFEVVAPWLAEAIAKRNGG
jgi:hypothetical protein